MRVFQLNCIFRAKSVYSQFSFGCWQIFLAIADFADCPWNYLLDLQKKITAVPWIKSLDIPLSDLTAKDNVNFSLTAQMK